MGGGGGEGIRVALLVVGILTNTGLIKAEAGGTEAVDEFVGAVGGEA